ncbi:MAG: hypothetical protein MUF64_17910 [Polyangiaceae bacterium]|jgi:hypothetical protein|nr:hypothetical protein [Polyangiaceae bacterium]
MNRSLLACFLAAGLLACGGGESASSPGASNIGGKNAGGSGQGGQPQAGSGGTAGTGGSSGSGTAGAGGGGQVAGTSGSVAPSPLEEIPGHSSLLQDTSPKELPRLMPAEVYIRSLLRIFGPLAPADMQAQFKALDATLFDTWNDYLAVLGLPDLRFDVPRAPQTNTLMVSTFERVGVALCDLAIQKDLKATPAVPLDKRAVFAFDPPKGVLTEALFATRFDSLHRTFLGYPAKLALTKDRTQRFFDLYKGTVERHKNLDTPKKYSPEEAGWAAVCYGLVRHPEFHMY